LRRQFAGVIAAAWLTVAVSAGTLVFPPSLQDARPDRVTVLWATAEPGLNELLCLSASGDSHNSAATARYFAPSETALGFDLYLYRAGLSGLAAATDYSCTIQVNGVPAASLTFRTSGPGPFRFLVFGDSGEGTPEQGLIAARMLAENDVRFVVHTGDIAYGDGTFSEFLTRHFNVYAPLMARAPFFPTPGNHEYYTRDAAPYLALHAPPSDGVPPSGIGRYYSFDWGDAHFVSIDSNLLENERAGEMLSWLERDLARTRRYWRIAVFHHPPYASGYHAADSLVATARQKLVPILEKHGVQLALSGHEHAYERTLALRGGSPAATDDGTVYIITGGGGAWLHDTGESPLQAFAARAHHYLRVEVGEGQLRVDAVGLNGEVIDSVTIRPAPAIHAGGVVNAATLSSDLAQGALVSVFGRNLAVSERAAPACPLPKELGRTTVTLDGKPLPLLYASAGQLNLQLPYQVSGQRTLRIANPNGASEVRISIAEAAPGILSVNGAPAVVHPDGQFVSQAYPATPGTYITIYMVGLGALDGPLEAGDPAPDQTLLRAVDVEGVRFGSVTVAPSFAGLTPRFAGLYQVNVQVPRISPGQNPLQVVTRTAASNTVIIPVR
jgi:uncharacterized protein (TIGR03437 family)